MKENERLLTRKEISEMYDVHPMSVYDWHKSYKIRPVKREGKIYYYDPVEVAQFDATRTRGKVKNSEVYSVANGREHGFALTLKGWQAWQKHKSLDDVPVREIIMEYDRPLEDDKK